MQPTIEILDRIRKNSRDNKEEIFTRLYRYLLRPDLYYLAYKNLYANKGAGTKGVNDDTADGFSKEKVDRIIQSLADGTYTPNPVRRKYIQKKQNSTKSSGMSTEKDCSSKNRKRQITVRQSFFPQEQSRDRPAL